MAALVNIYKDKKGNILMIPTAYDYDGVCRDVNRPETIMMPYDLTLVGVKLRQLIYVSEHAKINSPEEIKRVFEIATGIKSYSKFSKDRFLVWVEKDYHIFSLIPCERDKIGSFTPLREMTTTLNEDVSDMELGMTVLKTFESCTK